MPGPSILEIGGIRYEMPPTLEVIRLLDDDGVVVWKMSDTGLTTTDGKVTAGVVQPSGLSSNLRTGYIHLPLGGWRLTASNDVPAIAVASGNGGNLAVDSAPKLIRVNAATDKKMRIQWASSSSVEIMADFAYPPDLDDTAVVIFNALANMGGATDTPTLSIGYFEGVGDTDAGGATAALSNTVAHVTRTITAANIGAYPNGASIQIIPGAHTTDTCNILATWITYTRKA